MDESAVKVSVAILESSDPSDPLESDEETLVATGTEVSVIGVPFGAETAGSLILLSGRGRAAVKPERRATMPMSEEM